MANCDKSGNNSGNFGIGIPDDGQGIIRPERNIPPIISKKEENPYISPQNHETKKYRPLGSFLRTQSKDEAEPELPHNKSRKDEERFFEPNEPENKIAVDVSSTENRAHKNIDELTINPESPQKKLSEIDSVNGISEKENSEVNLNLIPQIKIGDDIFINSTRQTKNASIEIFSSTQRKVDKNVQDTNVHTAKTDEKVVVNTERKTLKNGISTSVEGKGEFIKEYQAINAVEPTESVKIDGELEIDANVALRDPKEFDNLWVDIKQPKKKDSEIVTEEKRDAKEEPELSETKMSKKDDVDISEPNKKSEKDEQSISSTEKTEKGEQSISDAPDGEQKSEKEIEDTIQENKTEEEIDEAPDGESKSEIKIKDTTQESKTEKEIDEIPAGDEKTLQEISEVEKHEEKNESSISDESNREGKTDEKDVNTDSGSSINDKNPDVQTGNVKYSIITPQSKQTNENDYTAGNPLRNKDKADDAIASSSQTEGGSKNIALTNNKSELINADKEKVSNTRKIKDSAESTNALSFSGFISETDSQIDGEISTPEATQYNENVFDKEYVLNNKNNLNRNIIYENQDGNFNSLESAIDSSKLPESNAGKLINETTKKSSVNVETVIGSPMGPSDQENKNYNYASHENSDKIIKASGDAKNADSFASINTATDELIKAEIYPVESKPIEDSDNAVVSNGQHIVNENLDYTDATLPHTAVKNNANFNNYKSEYASYSTEGDNTRKETISAKNLDVIIGQENADFDYTDFSSISIRTGKISSTDAENDYNFVSYNPSGFNALTDVHTVSHETLKDLGSGQQLTSQINYTSAVNYPAKADGTFDDISIIDFNNYKKEPSSSTEDYNATSEVLNTTTGKKQYSSQVAYNTNFGLRESIKPIQDGSAFIDFNNFDVEPSNFDLSSNTYTPPELSVPLNSVTSNINTDYYANLKQQVSYTKYDISDYGKRATPITVITKVNDLSTDTDETESRQRLGIGGLKSTTTEAVNTADDNPQSIKTYDGTIQSIYDSKGNILEKVYNNQETSNFEYTINNYRNRTKPTTIITTPDDPSTTADESVIRQLLGKDGLKSANLDSSGKAYSPINVVNDIFNVTSTYDGIHEHIYDSDGNIIGSIYNNQENTNFDFAAFNSIGLDSIKNSVFASSFMKTQGSDEINLTSFAASVDEFGDNDYTASFSSSRYYTDIDNKTITYKNSKDSIIASTDSSLKGFPISRDIIQNDGNNNVWKQLAANAISSTGSSTSLTAVSNIVSDFQSLVSINQTFDNFTLNNDYGNILRRTLTTELPAAVLSIKNGIDITGTNNNVQNALDGIFGVIGNIEDTLDSTGSYLNHPSLMVSKSLRTLLNMDSNEFDSGIGDIFTGGNINNINLLTQGSYGQHGGMKQAFSSDEKYDINHSFAVTASQWPKDGKTSKNNYGKDVIKNSINYQSIDQSKISDMAKDLGISSSAAYKTLISSYENISESSSYLTGNGATSIGITQPNPGMARDLTNIPPRNRNKTLKIPSSEYLTVSNHTEIRNDIKPEFDKSILYKDAGDIYGLPIPTPTNIFEYKEEEVNAKVPPYFVLNDAKKGAFGELIWGLNNIKLYKKDDFSKPADEASRNNITSLDYDDLKYVSDTFFSKSNNGIVTQNIPSIKNPHDIEIIFGDSNPKNNTIAISQKNEDNNYGGGKAAFVMKGTHKQLVSDNLNLVEGSTNSIDYEDGNAVSKKFFVKQKQTKVE